MSTKELTPRERADLMLKAKTHAGMIRALGLNPIGYWFEKKPSRPAFDPRDARACTFPPAADVEGLLWPGDLLDLTWSAEERALVLAYTKQTLPGSKMGWMGYSWCRLCEETAPPPDPKRTRLAPWETLGTSDFGDGVFVWPEGYSHYIEVHGLKPPQEFIDHILRQGGKFPDSKVTTKKKLSKSESRKQRRART